MGRAAPRGGNPYYDGPVTDHFDGKRFFNPGSPMTNSLVDFLRMRQKEESAEWPKDFPSGRPDRPPERVDADALRVTFVGHATFLIQTAGLNILTDPVWSDRCSPVPFLGPKRVNPPGIDFDDLPKIDVVLLSHNHYDHMDKTTVRRLVERDAPRFHHTTRQRHDPADRSADGIAVEAHDWGSRTELSRDIGVMLHQAHHWSARGVRDRRMALWAAFSLRTPAGNIYFAGDTGYGDGSHFRAARQAAGPFHLALLPIGAYAPQWFMSYSHQNPEEALHAFRDLEADNALAYHWGTFKLTAEPVEEPRDWLSEALARQGVETERFQSPLPGGTWQGGISSAATGTFRQAGI